MISTIDKAAKADFFHLVEKQPVEQANKKVLEVPHIELRIQTEFLKLWQDETNAKVHELRRKRQNGERGIKHLPEAAFQTIKQSHFNTLMALVTMAAHQLEVNNRAKDGSGKIHRHKPLSISTNNKVLQQRCRLNSTRTLYDHFDRLRYHGAILGKKNHGTQQNFEVHLPPNFLLIYDLKAPLYRPFTPILKKPVLCGLPLGLLQKMHLLGIIKEPINNSISTTLNVNKASHFQRDQNLTLSGKEPLKKEPKGSTPPIETDFMADRETWSSLKNQSKREIHYRGPRDFESFTAYLEFKCYLLLYTLMPLLWPGRELYEGAVKKIVAYLVANYFKHCRTESDVFEVQERMFEVAKMQAEWMKKDPGKRFMLLPKQYFDLKRKPRKNPENPHKPDYSGYLGGLRLLTAKREAAERERRKLIALQTDYQAQKLEQNFQRKLKRWKKEFLAQPSTYQMAKMRKVTARDYPHYSEKLEQFFQTHYLNLVNRKGA